MTGRGDFSPLVVVSSVAKHHPQEFRKYRSLVSWTVLSVIVLGSLYLLLSVSVSLYRRRHVRPVGDPVSVVLSKAEITSCFNELRDVSVALRKHLIRSHYLIAGDDSDELQRWADEGAVWRTQWVRLGERCRLTSEARTIPARRETEAMTEAYAELGNIQTIYTKSLERFAKDLAPRLGRLDRRLTKLGEKIGTAESPPGDKE